MGFELIQPNSPLSLVGNRVLSIRRGLTWQTSYPAMKKVPDVARYISIEGQNCQSVKTDVDGVLHIESIFDLVEIV